MAWMALENIDDNLGGYGLLRRASLEEVWLILNLLLPFIIYYYTFASPWSIWVSETIALTLWIRLRLVKILMQLLVFI